MGRWKREKGNFIPISVNVSRVDIYHTDLPGVLMKMVEENNLEPEDLHLEITESAYVSDSQQLLSVIEQLKALGFIIEMDDFGNGYSSLNTLSELPIDVLKIDLEFLRMRKMSCAENRSCALSSIWPMSSGSRLSRRGRKQRNRSHFCVKWGANMPRDITMEDPCLRKIFRNIS